MNTYSSTKKPNNRWIYFSLILLLPLSSCFSNEDATQAVGSNAEGMEELASTHSLSDTQFQFSNMELGKLEMHNFNQIVKANGMLDLPPQSHVSISPYYGGYIKMIDLLPGQAVKKGQTVLVLENPEYVQFQQDFLEVQSQLKYLKSDYERQKALYADNVSSEKNYLKAESDYSVARAKHNALKANLALMNIDANMLTLDNIQTRITLSSPIDGFVTQVNTTMGAYVNPSDVAIVIINNDHLHLELSVFENDISKIAVDQPILFKTHRAKGEVYEATVHLINKAVDAENRSINVHGHLIEEKNETLFSPGMYIEADIITSSASGLALPSEAVVDIDGVHYVLVRTNPTSHTYLQKEVKVGLTDKEYSEILNYSDFPEGTEFLVKGAFNLIRE